MEIHHKSMKCKRIKPATKLKAGDMLTVKYAGTTATGILSHDGSYWYVGEIRSWKIEDFEPYIVKRGA
jgi:hypothetical protein